MTRRETNRKWAIKKGKKRSQYHNYKGWFANSERKPWVVANMFVGT